MNGYHLTCFGLAIACLGSFGWAIRWLFTFPEGKTPTIRRLSGAATVCALVQIITVGLTTHITASLAEVAILLYAVTLGLFWWAVRTTLTRPLSFAYSTDQPVHLVSSGPYRWIRHPFYTSYLTAWIAGVFATQQAWLLITVVGMGWLYWSAARLEEDKFAASELAASYAAYKARTGRFLPCLSPATPVETNII